MRIKWGGGEGHEYPVYFHHQDELRARYKDDGSWEDPASATPDFPSFAAWLAWVADELSNGRAPESSCPTAFMNMPRGRRTRKNAGHGASRRRS